jgi:hypothetical protein
VEKYKGLHIVTEALAVAVTVPAALALAKHQGPLTKEQRKRLRMYAAATLVIDGYLLWKWFRK